MYWKKKTKQTYDGHKSVLKIVSGFLKKSGSYKYTEPEKKIVLMHELTTDGTLCLVSFLTILMHI